MARSPNPEELMRYLDGELAEGELERVETLLAGSTELRRELAIYRAIGKDIGDLSFSAETPDSVWSIIDRRIARPVGWTLVLVGALLWALYGAWVFVTSPSSPWEKMGIGTLAIGFLVLLASTVWERWREAAHDPYRHIER